VTSSLKIVLLAALVSVPSMAHAQDAMKGHDMSAMGSMTSTDTALPEICMSDIDGMDMAAGAMAPMDGMDEAHTALMDGMDQMNADMMVGGMADDIDVAFVCSMIPHHQGAISMAKAELQYGDDPWAKEMAQKVIDAQEQEIADMLAWLSEQNAK
jgi:uncharacterized protein (DUF305 family)